MSSTVSLRKIYLFDAVSDERLAEIESVLESRSYKAGDILFNIDDPGDELLIVADGGIGIFNPDPDNPGGEKPIRIFQEEEALGEMALIDKKPRSLSARAEEDSVVLVLKGEDFRRLVEEDVDISFAVMNGLSDKIRYTTSFLNEVRTWVGRVTDGGYDNNEILNQVNSWVGKITEGEYAGVIEDKQKYKDESISALAAEFATMAAKVKEREEELKREIVQLKIEIDETKRKEDAGEIMQSDFFKDLQARAAQLREKQDNEK